MIRCSRPFVKPIPTKIKSRQRVFVWAIVGLLLEKTISLAALALVIVSPAKAASRVRRLRRFLANRHVCVRAYYDGFIRQALSAWGDQRLYLVLDTTTLSGRLVILLCVARLPRSGRAHRLAGV